jgi:hypothetical protein
MRVPRKRRSVGVGLDEGATKTVSIDREIGKYFSRFLPTCVSIYVFVYLFIYVRTYRGIDVYIYRYIYLHNYCLGTALDGQI